jgi:hypothetical protein
MEVAADCPTRSTDLSDFFSGEHCLIRLNINL